MSRSRVVELTQGHVMVVTDLHGDWDLYQRYRNRFLKLRREGRAKTLVFAGDLIHSDGPAEEDRSLEIILDLIELEARLGPDLVVLLGNHEMPHIYHVSLARGNRLYTPRFEQAMSPHRERILAFFKDRPFFACTSAGVTICHAGAFPEAEDPEAIRKLCTFSHTYLLDGIEKDLVPEQRAGLRKAIGELSGTTYGDLARTYLSIEGPGDPHYDDYLIGVFAGYRDDFKLLWSALFSRNEHGDGIKPYTRHVTALLTHLGRQTGSPQSILVTGHIGCRGGYRVLADGRQLRLASGAHAHPSRSARYLLFDAERPIRTSEDLIRGIGTVLEDD